MDLDKLNNILGKGDYIAFTTDLDWAPEVAICDLLELFCEYDVAPTVFMTHSSDEIFSRCDELDLGIHPNLIQPSSQGGNVREVLDYCCNLVPEAKGFRCHRWYASNDVYKFLWEKGYRYESNICTDRDVLRPFTHRSGMVSFPVFFEDGAHIEHNRELNYREFRDDFRQKGLKVINIHPMHYALNTPYFAYTRRIKDTLSREEWNGMNEDKLFELRFDGKGIRDFIKQIISDAIERKAQIMTLSELYDICNGDGLNGNAIK